MRTQTRRSRTILRQGRIALRDCPAHVAADIDVADGDIGSEADSYSVLMDYLTGSNARRQLIAVREPIQQADDDEWLLTERGPPIRSAVRFEFPEGTFLGNLPEPADPRIHLTNVPARRLATTWFFGQPSEDRVARNSDKLQNFITLKGLTPLSQGGAPSLLARRHGPFRAFTELSIPIAGWPLADVTRTSHSAHRAPGRLNRSA
ncbi:MAG: heme-binding protein [Hyphomonas sp.]